MECKYRHFLDLFSSTLGFTRQKFLHGLELPLIIVLMDRKSSKSFLITSLDRQTVIIFSSSSLTFRFPLQTLILYIYIYTVVILKGTLSTLQFLLVYVWTATFDFCLVFQASDHHFRHTVYMVEIEVDVISVERWHVRSGCPILFIYVSGKRHVMRIICRFEL